MIDEALGSGHDRGIIVNFLDACSSFTKLCTSSIIEKFFFVYIGDLDMDR